MRLLKRIVLTLVLVVALLAIVIKIVFGRGTAMPDYSGQPVRSTSDLEVVANLDYPPGNIAVSNDNRIFITLHPEGKPKVKVAELVGGEPLPFPNSEFQKPRDNAPFFETVLALRIDSKNGYLWTLDYANFATGIARLLAFDIKTGTVVHEYVFDREIAGLGSMLNDFQVDSNGRYIYIADASFFRRNFAIVVYDTQERKARRLLENDVSVKPQDFIADIDGMKQTFFGIMANRPGVDSIALDKKDEWLYYSAVTTDTLYRVRTRDLLDESLSKGDLSSRVKPFAQKTMSDGITMDLENNIYISDMEHSAIMRLGPDGNLVTLFKDKKLRWPDGFSFGPNGMLYFTCSSLQYVILKSRGFVASHSPYQIFRFKTATRSIPGQ